VSGARLRRTIVLVALGGAAVAAGAIVTSGSDGYVLYAKFRQAGGLRQGFTVRLDGAPVGQIESLDLDKRDLVVAKLRVDKSVVVGTDVRATARSADLLGEKFVDLVPGDTRHPAASGTVIPPSRTSLAVELDDVINAVDLPTRRALQVFINEQGSAYVGRGKQLGATLAALPGALDRTGALLDAFAQDNRALDRLVVESDRVVGSVAREHLALGRIVGAAGATFFTLGQRSRELGETIRRAPATLVAARRALAALEGAAIPLGPAARGLRVTAPQLTATLKQLPAFASAARPTLRSLLRVAPKLREFGRSGAPLVRRLRPLTGELARFATAFDPVDQTLDTGVGDILGVLEGWARSTQARDTASHVFRFGVTLGPGTITALGSLMAAQSKQAAASRRASPALAAALQQAAQVAQPAAAAPSPGSPQRAQSKIADVLGNVTQDLGLGSGPQSGSQSGLVPLLDYLMGA
jgi:virulence factor Mce-like protein